MSRKPSVSANEMIATVSDYQRGRNDQMAIDVETIRARREELKAKFRELYPNPTAAERAEFEAEMHGYTKASRLLWNIYQKSIIGKSIPEGVDSSPLVL